MSREWVGSKASAGWVMVCDRLACKTRSEVAPRADDLPLERFVTEGWFIAKTHGDRCPTCVAAEGGMAAVLTNRRALAPVGDRPDAANPCWPHALMGAA